MNLWSKRSGDLETRLRMSRPIARDEFVAALEPALDGRRRVAKRRAGFAIALTVVMIASLSAFGGIGYAAHAIADGYSSAAKIVKKTIKKPQRGNVKALKGALQTPASFQYHGTEGGCTPGYWKQDQHFFAWGGVSQNQSFYTTFGVTSAQTGLPADLTLLEALGLNGGGGSALARHAVAAYLNSLRPGMNFPYSTSQVVSMVQAAYLSGNAATIEDTKNQLEAANSLEGPLC